MGAVVGDEALDTAGRDLRLADADVGLGGGRDEFWTDLLLGGDGAGPVAVEPGHPDGPGRVGAGALVDRVADPDRAASLGGRGLEVEALVMAFVGPGPMESGPAFAPAGSVVLRGDREATAVTVGGMPRQDDDGSAGRRSPARPWTLAAIAAVAAAVVVAVLLLTGTIGGDGFDAGRIAEAGRSGGSADPFAWKADRTGDFERRAALGLSHVLYEKSPGGIVASARRTARWRDQIEQAATAHGADPDVMEAMVLLESAGRPEVIAGDDPEAASGLAQIVSGTGTDLLGMRVDLARSRALTKRIARVEAEMAKAKRQSRSKQPKVRTRALMKLRRLPNQEQALRKRRAAVDERFDPEAALDGMGKYLEIAADRFGRADLATTSYHMGIGNLENVIAAYREETPVDDPSYAQLFFDSSPLVNAEVVEAARLVRRRQLDLPLEGPRRRADHGPLPQRPFRARAARGAAGDEGDPGGGLPSGGRH